MALGMLALFSLLAVTWVVSASSSRAGAQAMRVRAGQSNTSIKGMASEVMKMAVRGTRDQKSAFYQHSLLEDVYDANAIRLQFGHRNTSPIISGMERSRIDNDTVLPFRWCSVLTPSTEGMPDDPDPDHNNYLIRPNFLKNPQLIKLSLDPRQLALAQTPADYTTIGSPVNHPTNFVISPIENAYNGRVLTVLEGPLAGHSFHIVKYVGFVRHPSDANLSPGFQDPNYNNGAYQDPDAFLVDYSIVIDIGSVKGKLEGRWRNYDSDRIEGFSGEIEDWIKLPNCEGIRNLFYFCDDVRSGRPNVYTGYKCVINGAAFTNAGIGLETDSSQPGFGNLDSHRLMALPANAGKRVSPALLPNYDYLQHRDYMSVNGGVLGVSGVGDQGLLKGQSNEGFDVPDWRDFWLSYADSNTNIPSFHRPELIHYLSHLYGTPTSPGETYELLRWLDASTARVLSYGDINPYFQPYLSSPRIEKNEFSNVNSIRNYLEKLIIGPWDVDNDGDGIPDSVWINPNLPSIHSPDGRLLKPLAAIMIRDLDGRLNINLHGDRIQGRAGNGIGNPNGFETYGYSQGLLRAGRSVSQGFGFGPADISLNPLFLFSKSPRDPNRVYSGLLTSSPSNYSLFDLRYGARRYSNDSFNPNVDRSPGIRGDDPQSRLMQREVPGGTSNFGTYTHGTMPGAPLGRRTGTAPTFDKHGNLTFLTPRVLDAYPEQPSSISDTDPQTAHEFVGDAYEAGSGNRDYGDSPFTLADLESFLRGYDEDVAALPNELKNRVVKANLDLSMNINQLITTHSAELRYPKLATAAVVDGKLEPSAGNMLGLIKLLHEQRYKKPGEPSIPTESLYSLFPPEFSSNLRLNLNRPLGNGRNDNEKDANGNIVDNQIDEPRESRLNQYEAGGPGSYLRDSYLRGINLSDRSPSNPQNPNRILLGSRQLLARYLYCIGQLVIPRDYLFPVMLGVPDQFTKDRLRARAIAQWAVNVVDFRDTDAVMTRFEFDIYPFGVTGVDIPSRGRVSKVAYWSPDKLINPPSIDDPANRSVRPFIDIVWGMEMPELLLTESLAFHDKRIRNTDMDNGAGSNKLYEPGKGDDDDFDQYRFPQGSLFLELYAPRSTYVENDPVLAGAPSSLYTLNTNRRKLDVSRMAPTDRNGIWGAQPVWRIGLSESTPPSPANSPQKQLMPNVRYQGPDVPNSRLEWLDPQVAPQQDLQGFPNYGNPEINLGSGLYHDLGNFSTQTVEFERLIWFSNFSLDVSPRVPNLKGDSNGQQKQDIPHMVYYNRDLPNVHMDGGSYLVVGPRIKTSIGSASYNPNEGTPWQPDLIRNQLNNNLPILSPSHQGISLSGSSISTTLLNGKTVFDYRPDWLAAIKAPIALSCAADPPGGPRSGPNGNTSWSDCFPRGVGINISVPNPILNQGYWKSNLMPAWKLNTDDRQQGRADRQSGFNDIEPDSFVDCVAPASTFPDEPFDYNPSTNPILATPGAVMNATGTYDNVRTAYLQRLADPEEPYDPVSNPYITVDWIAIDLTVFNGEATKNSDPADQGSGTVAFQSRYKDGGNADTAKQKFTIDSKGPPSLPTPRPKDWGYSYHSSSTARLRATPRQKWMDNWTPDPPNGKYPSYFDYQLGFTADDVINFPMNAPNSATTLGYVNVGYRGIDGGDTAESYDGFGPPQLIPSQSDYNGSPRDMTSPVWLNRQFANAHELALVPLTSPGQFGYFFSAAHDTTSRTPFRYLPAFNDANPLVSKMTNASQDPQSDFSRFPGAVESDERSRGYWMRRRGSWDNSTQSTMAADWGFVLEFVETPTPYVDTVKRLNPTNINVAYAQGDWHKRFLGSFIRENYPSQDEPERFIGMSLLEPHNILPTYVSPGKVNLNTS